MGPAAEPRRPKVMRVSTRCRTVDELVAAFATLVDAQSLVVLTDQQREIGTRQPFVVELSDGTMVMRGEAEVIESTAPPKGRLRLKFLALDASGREIHARMLDRKRGGTGATPAPAVAGGLPPVKRHPTDQVRPIVVIPERRDSGAVPVVAAPPGADIAAAATGTLAGTGKQTGPMPSLGRIPTPARAVPIIPPPRTADGTSPKVTPVGPAVKAPTPAAAG
jgi:hypothetical protein